MFRSKLCEAYPPESVELPAEFGRIVVTAQSVQAEIERLRSQFQTIELRSAPAEQGDFVRVVSGERSYTFNTARPYIQPELTEACLGQCTGAHITDPDGIQWTITAVKGKVLPPFDDALARRGGAGSAADFIVKTKEKLTDDAEKRSLYEAVEFLSQRLIQNSRYALVPEEVQQLQDELVKEITAAAREAEVSPEAVTGDWLQMFGLPEPEQLASAEQAAAEMAEYELKTILLGSGYLEQLGGAFSEALYEKAVTKLAAEEGISEEKARNSMSFTAFLFEKAAAQVNAFARKYLERTIRFDITVEE